ncbi:DUF1700 domain-containing protein [Oscillospiraceae bacterium MB08-C2-2]|nr:DUF1700 domain-containing protein [Oscillospiraceae bacterium MB08-C2-2]
MNKLEYLNALERELQGKLPVNEIDDILRDYAEYFNDGTSQGIPEEQTAYRLGTPAEVARQIVAENCPPDRGFTAYYSRMRTKMQKEKNSTAKWIWVIVLIVTFPVWFGALAAVVGTLFAALFAAAALVVALLAGGAVMIGLIFVWMGEISALASVYMAIGGIGLLALGVCVVCLLVMTVRGISRAIRYQVQKRRPGTGEVDIHA